MAVGSRYGELGTGIYSIPDIAFLLRIPQQKVRRWLNDFWDTRMVAKFNDRKYSWGDGRDKAADFYTLIEFYVFFQLREMKVSPRKILSAHEEMAKTLKTRYPFANSKVLTDGNKILYALKDGTTVMADKSNQIVFKEIMESFCRKIEFSDKELAERYWPLGKRTNIVVDPSHQFGQPTIGNTNILAENIYNLYTAGESVQFLSRLYSLQPREVNDAIRLFKTKAA